MTTVISERLAWREGWRPRGVTVEDASRELERIYRRDGQLTPNAVLIEAAPKDSPLHPIFTWDDAVAAQQYRLSTARTVIRAVRVIRPDAIAYSKFVAIRRPATEQAGHPRLIYRQAADVAQNEAEAMSAIKLLVERVHSAQQSVMELKSLLGDGDSRIGTMIALSEALTTATVLARTL